MRRTVRPAARFAPLIMLVATASVVCCSFESIVEYYRVMTVDPQTLKVSFSGFIGSGYVGEIQGDYYESRINVSIEPHRRTITHYEKVGESAAVMLDSLMIHADGTLIYRDKRQVVARLPDATLLAQTEYYYADEYRQALPTVLIHVDKDPGWQVPDQVHDRLTSPLATVTGAAIVRVLKEADGSVIVGSANYGVDGRLRALNTRSLHDGQVDNSNVTFTLNGQVFGNGTSLVDEPAKRAAFGFPGQFSVTGYLREPRLPATPAATSAVTDLVIVEYNFNEWMQCDRYESGRQASTQMLHVKELPEDRMLAPIDRRGWK